MRPCASSSWRTASTHRVELAVRVDGERHEHDRGLAVGRPQGRVGRRGRRRPPTRRRGGRRSRPTLASTASSVAGSSTARPSTTPISVGPVTRGRIGRRQRARQLVESFLGARRLRGVATAAHVGGQRREQRRRRGDARDDDEQPDGEGPAGMAGGRAAESLQHASTVHRSRRRVVGPRAEPPAPTTRGRLRRRRPTAGGAARRRAARDRPRRPGSRPAPGRAGRAW